jgi:hypothetical protein
MNQLRNAAHDRSVHSAVGIPQLDTSQTSHLGTLANNGTLLSVKQEGTTAKGGEARIMSPPNAGTSMCMQSPPAEVVPRGSESCAVPGLSPRLEPVPQIAPSQVIRLPLRKTVTVESAEPVSIGEDWTVLVLLRCVCNANNKCWQFLQSWEARLATWVWTMACLMAFSGFNIWALTTESPGNDISVPIFVVQIVVGIAGLLNFIGRIWRAILIKCYESPAHGLATAISWVQLFYHGCLVYLTIAILIEHNPLGWVYLAAIFSIPILQCVNIVLWMGGLGLFLLLAGLEGLVRVIMCRTKCPTSEKIKNEYTYSVFCYELAKMPECAGCSICLGTYSPVSVDLCILQCSQSHVFHEACIFEWLKKSARCPLCRAPAQFQVTSIPTH